MQEADADRRFTAGGVARRAMPDLVYCETLAFNCLR